MRQESLVKLIKFGMVGFIGLTIDFTITYLLKEHLLVNKYISNGLGFFIAASVNFLLNRVWTFNSKSNFWREYVIFFCISITGLTINSFIVYLCSDYLHLNFYVSKLIAVGVVFFWNFFMNHKFNFKYDIVDSIKSEEGIKS